MSDVLDEHPHPARPHSALFWRVAISVGVIATVVRLVVLAVAARVAPYQLTGDAATYDELARSLLAGAGFARHGTPTGFVVPGYPLFLAAVYALFGHSLAPVGAIQALLEGSAAACAALIAGRLAGPFAASAAWTAGLIAAVYPHFLIWTGFALTENLALPLSIFALWLLVEAQVRGSRRWYAAAGLALAGAVLTRSNLVVFVPVAAVLVLVLDRRRPFAVRSTSAAALLGCTMLPLTIWATRNAIVIGTPTLATEGGVVLWLGQNPNASARHVNGYVYGEPLPSPVPEGAGELESNERYTGAALDYLRSHPLAPLQHAPAKVWNMWRPTFAGARLRTWLLFGGSYLFLMGCAALGLARTLARPAQPAVRYLQWYILSLVVSHVIMIAEIRYRMPIELVLTVFAGLALAPRMARRAAAWPLTLVAASPQPRLSGRAPSAS